MTAVTRAGLLVALAVALASAVAGLLAPLWTPKSGPGVTLANFLRIRDGMTMEEVTALFGREPDRSMGRSHYFVCSWYTGGYVFAEGDVADVTFEHEYGRFDEGRVTSRTFSRPGEADVTLPTKTIRLWVRGGR